MQVISSWDDGSVHDIRMSELMNKYKIPTTFYWPSLFEKAKDVGQNNQSLSLQSRKEIASNFIIGSHSATHQAMKKMSIAQLSMEISDSKKSLQDLTGQEISSFAYPKNSMTSLVKGLVKGAGYKSARSNIPGFLKTSEDVFSITCTVQIGIDRVEYKNKCWEYFADEMLEKSNEESIFHIFGNSWEIEKYNDWENLESLLIKLTS